MQNHQQSADRIAKVTKEIWRRLVLKGKLPAPAEDTRTAEEAR